MFNSLGGALSLHQENWDWARCVATGLSCSVAAVMAQHLYFRFSQSRKQRMLMEQKQIQADESKTRIREEIKDSGTLPEMSYRELSQKLQSGEVSPLEVLQNFQRKALEADGRVNAVTEMVIEASVFCDKLISLPENQRGSLFGIPLSLKECIALEGYDLTLGCATQCLQPVSETHFLVKTLLKAGMVPFVRTNTSQLCRTNLCRNPIFGETVNPHDHSRTAGSSSGGEAALIASGGSLVGLGTDIGGSVRIPAFFCGIFGFRPTSDRVRGKKIYPEDLDMTILFINDSVGPLSSDFDLIVEVMRAFFSRLHFNLNPAAVPLQFDNEVFHSDRPLRIGYYTSFRNNLFVLKPIPAVERLILETKASLEAHGHTLIPWDPPQIDQACQLIMQCVHLDGGQKVKRFMAKEMLVSKNVQDIYALPIKSDFSKRILSAFYRLIDSNMSNYLQCIRGARNISDVFHLASAVRDYRENFEASWDATGLDGLICPMWENLAPRSFEAESFWSDGMYSKLYNFIDYPSGIVPLGSVTKQDIEELQDSYPRFSDMDKRLIESQTNTVGLPLGVQCVAMKYRDEMALRIMREVRDSMTF